MENLGRNGTNGAKKFDYYWKKYRELGSNDIKYGELGSNDIKYGELGSNDIKYRELGSNDINT